MNEPFDPTIIIFAVLAIFVLYKLRSVLGARTGHEQRPPAPPPQRGPGAPPADNVVRLPGAAAASQNRPASPAERWSKVANEKAWPGLDAIAAADASFAPDDFMSGATAAYEMIVVAFAAGDRATLRNLLETEVYDSFEGSIRAREAAERTSQTTFVSLDQAMIDDAQLRGATAHVSVRFRSKIISVTRDKAGAVVEGSPDKTVEMVDLWTFARPAPSRDPNWKLVATETVH